jgi:hypothetical protein
MDRWDELLKDCRLLFGRNAVVDRQFLESLQLVALKSAFRRAALVTHPDLYSGQSKSVQNRHAELFIGASEAYKRLSLFLTGKGFRLNASQATYASAAGRRPPRPSPAQPDRSGARSSGPGQTEPGTPAGARPPHCGRIYAPDCAPAWPLRTGEFLYYSKVISWKLLISAIVWQRRQRERIGEIARRWGWLSEDQLLEVAAGRYLGERIGEVLLRHDRLTPFQLRTLLHFQRKSQQPIGRFFVEQRLLSERELDRYLVDLGEHNRWFRELTIADPFDLWR